MAISELTREIAIKVRDTVDAGLSHGVGQPIPGQMCVEAAVCYALGLPHGDDPGCVAPALRQLKIGLNDRSWSSPQARAQGLRRLAVAQLGSAGVLDEAVFIQRVVDMTIRKAVPVGLRAAARVNPAFADRLEAAAVRCATEGTREACRAAEDVAADARRAAASAAAADAAYAASAAAYSAARAAAYSAARAADAASAAADAASAAAYSAAGDAARDRVLAQYAEWVVEILCDLTAPGCQWLDLVPLEASHG